MFTIGALDNLDHKPSSTSYVDAFHGTGLSLFQFPTKANPGESRPPITIPPVGTKQHSLPDSYAIVPAVALTANTIQVPKQSTTVCVPAVCVLLPLFYEKSATPATIKHGLDKAIEYLNPGQIPVTTFDQPLFVLAKLVQWKWPDVYGESVHIVMMGGLHNIIEMTLWNTLGDILESSGWTAALTEAEVASSGTADSFLKASHLT